MALGMEAVTPLPSMVGQERIEHSLPNDAWFTAKLEHQSRLTHCLCSRQASNLQQEGFKPSASADWTT